MFLPRYFDDRKVKDKVSLQCTTFRIKVPQTNLWLSYKQEKYTSALEWIKKALGNGGEDSGVVLEHYGDILYKLGEIEKAIDFWNKAKKKKDYSDLLDKKIQDGKMYE